MVIVLLGFFGLIGLGLIFIAMSYNRLIQGRIKVDEGWSGVEVQLKRRHDLVPNLVNTVKGYAGHEKEVLTEVTEARNQTLQAGASLAQTTQSENALTAGISKLLAVAEAYPDLKANTNFLELQRELTEIEDALQSSRRYYNGTVRDYEMSRQSFPSNIIANQFNFEKREYFELDDPVKEGAVPEVKF